LLQNPVVGTEGGQIKANGKTPLEQHRYATTKVTAAGMRKVFRH